LLERKGATEYLERVDIAWGRLQSVAASDFPGLRLERGVEMLLDAPQVDLSDPRLRLAGTRFVLVEFPWSGIPVNSARALFNIKMSGYTPIVAHPERYADMDKNLDLAEEWVNSGAHLQLNEGSLIGQYGVQPRALGWRALERGLASYLCSDYHSRGKCPTAAMVLSLKKRNGAEAAYVLTDVNPHRMLGGLDPESVPSVRAQPRSWWRRFTLIR
jgi:protein-tyrosine phosphatase